MISYWEIDWGAGQRRFSPGGWHRNLSWVLPWVRNSGQMRLINCKTFSPFPLFPSAGHSGKDAPEVMLAGGGGAGMLAGPVSFPLSSREWARMGCCPRGIPEMRKYCRGVITLKVNFAGNPSESYLRKRSDRGRSLERRRNKSIRADFRAVLPSPDRSQRNPFGPNGQDRIFQAGGIFECSRREDIRKCEYFRPQGTQVGIFEYFRRGEVFPESGNTNAADISRRG